MIANFNLIATERGGAWETSVYMARRVSYADIMVGIVDAHTHIHKHARTYG